MTSSHALRQSDFAAALLDPALACPAGLMAWNGSDPAARLAVHRNNVAVSLVDAMADTFGVVQELVGEEFFRAMAQVFVRQSPPRSRILAHYGGAFPEFIERFGPAGTVPYLADVARLEWARVQAYHAADADPVAIDRLSDALAAGDRIADLLLTCHPSVGVVRSRFAVVSIWAAHQDGGDLGEVDPFLAEDALVVRSDLDVAVMRLPPGAAEFVSLLGRGRSFGDACGAATAKFGEFDLPATLAVLLRHGTVTSIELPGET